MALADHPDRLLAVMPPSGQTVTIRRAAHDALLPALDVDRAVKKLLNRGAIRRLTETKMTRAEEVGDG